MGPCSFVRFQALIVMLEQVKYRELTKGLCQPHQKPAQMAVAASQAVLQAKNTSFMHKSMITDKRQATDTQQQQWQHVQGWVGGHHLWHVALEGGRPHPQKISATFTFKKVVKNIKIRLHLARTSYQLTIL